MEKQIEIEYRNLPSELFVDIATAFRCYDIFINIYYHKEEDEYFNGGPADVVVYVNVGLTKLISNGLLCQEIYKLIKHSISSTWKKIRYHYSKKKIKQQLDKHYISLNFRIDILNSVEFKLMGNVKREDIARLTEKIFCFLTDKARLQNDLNNPALKNNHDDVEIISLNFNFENNAWRPINYSEYRKKMDKILRQLFDKLRN